MDFAKLFYEIYIYMSVRDLWTKMSKRHKFRNSFYMRHSKYLKYRY